MLYGNLVNDSVSMLRDERITQLRSGIASLPRALLVKMRHMYACLVLRRCISTSELPSNTASPGIPGARGGSVLGMQLARV